MAPLHEGCRSVLYHVATTLWLCSFDSMHSVQCRTSAPTAACKLGGIHPFPFMTASLLMERSLMQWALFHIEKLSMLDCDWFRAWTTRCSFPRSRRSQSATDGRLVICGSCCCHMENRCQPQKDLGTTISLNGFVAPGSILLSLSSFA